MYCEWMSEVCLEATEKDMQEYYEKQKTKENKLSLKDRFAIWLLNL